MTPNRPATWADIPRIEAEVRAKAALEDRLWNEWYEANKHRCVLRAMRVMTGGKVEMVPILPDDVLDEFTTYAHARGLV